MPTATSGRAAPPPPRRSAASGPTPPPSSVRAGRRDGLGGGWSGAAPGRTPGRSPCVGGANLVTISPPSAGPSAEEATPGRSGWVENRVSASGSAETARSSSVGTGTALDPVTRVRPSASTGSATRVAVSSPSPPSSRSKASSLSSSAARSPGSRGRSSRSISCWSESTGVERSPARSSAILPDTVSLPTGSRRRRGRTTVAGASSGATGSADFSPLSSRPRARASTRS